MVDTTFTDSYITTDAILEAMIGNDPQASAVALKAAAASAQAWYCQEATRRIDALPIRGTKYDYDQVLEFPRIIDGVVVGDADHNAVVPDLVERACLEEAIAILAAGNSGGRQALQDQGVASYQIPGIISETFRPGVTNARYGLRSPDAYRLLSRYIARSVPIV